MTTTLQLWIGGLLLILFGGVAGAWVRWRCLGRPRWAGFAGWSRDDADRLMALYASLTGLGLTPLLGATGWVALLTWVFLWVAFIAILGLWASRRYRCAFDGDPPDNAEGTPVGARVAPVPPARSGGYAEPLPEGPWEE